MLPDSTAPVDEVPADAGPTAGISLDATGPRYRGHRAIELSDGGVPFEGVAELLWTGAEPRRAWWPTTIQPGPALRRMPPTTDICALLRFALSAMALDDPHRLEIGLKEDLARARQIIPMLAIAIGGAFDRRRVAAARGGQNVAERLLLALGGKTVHAPEMNRALVLCAAHQISPADQAIQAAAACGVDLYGCLAVGYAARRGNGIDEHCRAIEGFAESVGSPRWAADVVADRISKHERVPGFGHPEYPAGDPRATALLALARRTAPEDHGVRTLDSIASAMASAGQPPPRLAFGLVSLCRALGLGPGTGGAIFCIARLAGRTALVLERRRTRTSRRSA